MRKICVVTERRSEYGILKPILKEIDESKTLELSLVVTGMHLSEKFGLTVKEIEADGFRIAKKIPVPLESDSGSGMAVSAGDFLSAFAEFLENGRPDIILIGFDLGAHLAGAIAGCYMNIPVAHIHGGDVSGSADEPVRHAITKLSHIHFPASQGSAERIIRMGEEPWRVHVAGAPGLDSILGRPLPDESALSEKYGFMKGKPFILAVQHPVTAEEGSAARQVKETMKAVSSFGIPAIFIYPNADAGGRKMIDVLEKQKTPGMNIFRSIPHDDYLGLMRYASVMVGNSSSAIIEAPSFGIPTVNIGTRQQGRERAENVIDVPYDSSAIRIAMEKCLNDKAFRESVKRCESPYGDGKASKRIVKVLEEIELGEKLLNKRMTY